MKYVSLDLETTSLQPAPEHILQISMVVEDSERPEIDPLELPHFTVFVNPGRITGEAYALAMNGWILDYISGRAKYPPYSVMTLELAVAQAHEFLSGHFGVAKITVAGKNVAGFDMPFLPVSLQKRFRHKVLDPGTLFVNWATDDQAPNFEECKRRAGLEGPVAHDAREDAMDVIKLLRTKYK